MKQVFIFDFDGTIADSVPTIIRIINSLANEFGYKKLTEKKIKQYRHESLNHVLMYELGIAKFKLPFLILKMRSAMKNAIANLRPIPDIKTVIATLSKQNYPLYILTYNKVENVKLFLMNNKITGFDAIYACNPYLGKTRTIKKLLKEQKIRADEAFYIGDDIIDIKSAKKAGVKAVAVTWGTNSRIGLTNYSPEFILDNPQELLTIADLYKAKNR